MEPYGALMEPSGALCHNFYFVEVDYDFLLCMRTPSFKEKLACGEAHEKGPL